MARTYKVYGTSHYFHKHVQCRAVVATITKKKAAELLEMNMYSFRLYAAETKNTKEVKAAMKKRETVIVMEKYG